MKTFKEFLKEGKFTIDRYAKDIESNIESSKLGKALQRELSKVAKLHNVNIELGWLSREENFYISADTEDMVVANDITDVLDKLRIDYSDDTENEIMIILFIGDGFLNEAK